MLDRSSFLRDTDELRELISASGLFDPEFYQRAHPEIAPGIDPLEHYIQVGIAAGHQSSEQFNPELYLAQNPDVAESGQPALLHFLYYGRAEGRRLPDQQTNLRELISKSGLFDENFYQEYYHDVSKSYVDPIEHYIERGRIDHRRPSLEFDSAAYASEYRDVEISGIDPFVHYLRFGREEGRIAFSATENWQKISESRQQILASNLFDVDYYLSENNDVHLNSIDPVLHYLIEGFKSFREVSPRFSLKRYIIEAGLILDADCNPLIHFLNSDKSTYLLLDQSARPQNTAQHQPGRLFHVEYSRMESAAFISRFAFKPSCANYRVSLIAAIEKLRHKELKFKVSSETPDVSIIIPIYGQMPHVLNCLDALSMQRSRFSVEILIADDSSSLIEGTDLLLSIPWVKYVKQQNNVGYIENCNTTVNLCVGKYIVFLHSDSRPVDRWLDELIGTFELFPNAGYVGSQLINLDGTLQEAGGVYFSNGVAMRYGLGESYLNPRYNYARHVDWVSSASIAIPKNLWCQLEGFDRELCPAFYEDLDLAFRVKDLGLEVWYQPLSRVLHFGSVTYSYDSSSKISAHQAENARKIYLKWRHKFNEFRINRRSLHEEANRKPQSKMLVVAAAIHTPDRDAGSLVASEMMNVFRSIGLHQIFAGISDFSMHQPYTENYQRVGVEVLYAPFVNSTNEAVIWSSTYDYALVFRYSVCGEIIKPLRNHVPTCRILFSNVDLHYLRMMREAILKQDRSIEISASYVKTLELDVMTKVDCSIVHTSSEKEIVVKELPYLQDNIIEFSWVKEPVISAVPLAVRKDVMFLGGFSHRPNADAVMFFAEEIWPLLVSQLDSGAKFVIVGSSPPDFIMNLASDRIIVTGHVPDLSPYFDRARVFVAPLRFGAGIKGKLIEAMANGVPAVATSIAAEGMGLINDKHFLQADTAKEFYNAIISLFADEGLSLRVQNSGYAFVKQNFSRGRAMQILEQALDLADATWLSRQKSIRARKLRRSAKKNGFIQP